MSKNNFRCKVNEIRLQSLSAAFLPIRYKLNFMHSSFMDSHNRVLSTFEDISRQVQSRLDGVYSRLQTTNTILLLYGVALTAISIVLLFV